MILFNVQNFLVLIKECCKDAQEYIPDYLDDIVDKLMIVYIHKNSNIKIHYLMVLVNLK